MAKKMIAVFLICIVMVAALHNANADILTTHEIKLNTDEAKYESKFDAKYKSCYETCLNECKHGSGESYCEVKCDEDCGEKEVADKLKIDLAH